MLVLENVMNTSHITDFDIQALVDGEVDDEELARLMDVVNSNPTLYNRYMAYKRQKSLLKSWWKDN